MRGSDSSSMVSAIHSSSSVLNPKVSLSTMKTASTLGSSVLSPAWKLVVMPSS
ncbi:hypothetical protein ES707_05271 [subsurface metagenome]